MKQGQQRPEQECRTNTQREPNRGRVQEFRRGGPTEIYIGDVSHERAAKHHPFDANVDNA